MQRFFNCNCQPGMKQLFLFTITVLLLASCKKDDQAAARAQFAGTWEYYRFVGYPFNTAPLPRGNGKIIVFGTDGSFERKTHDTTTFSGSYTLTQRKDCYGDARFTFFKCTDPNFAEYTISVSGDTLLLNSSNCLADGGSAVYLRN